MSWKSGGALFDDIVEVIDEWVDDKSVRLRLYTRLVSSFMDGDCDTMYEDSAVRDQLTLRKAFVATGYWREEPQYGEFICHDHYRRYGDNYECEECGE
jgi:hypothetical protein